jgi:flavin reductase (DIM6/NTAB) family NADH-FMN oxidoreductase RutF
MDIPWGSPAAKKFVTNVGLISSHGPHGDDIMAAEWTHQVSYSPALIAVSLGNDRATLENIKATGEFGVVLAAPDQAELASVSGTSTAKKINKIKALEELGCRFHRGKHIKCLLPEGGALTVELKVKEIVPVGDHTLIIGEAVNIHIGEAEPVAFHGGIYWQLTEQLPKPSQAQRDRIGEVVAKHQKV